MSEKNIDRACIAPRDEKILRFLGLAAKAGRLIAGADKIVDAARSGMLKKKGSVIIVSADASPRTKKNIMIAARKNEISCFEINAGMAVIGLRTGSRGSTSAAAVTDRHMASAVEAAYSDETEDRTKQK